jgi:hypothetical protein
VAKIAQVMLTLVLAVGVLTFGFVISRKSTGQEDCNTILKQVLIRWANTQADKKMGIPQKQRDAEIQKFADFLESAFQSNTQHDPYQRIAQSVVPNVTVNDWLFLLIYDTQRKKSPFVVSLKEKKCLSKLTLATKTFLEFPK